MMNINGIELGKDVFVIAEIGSNHNQSLDLAFESIDAAVESGADAAKFQSLNVHELYLNPPKRIKDLHKKIDLQENWHYELSEYCEKKGITFFSAPTYLRAVDILEEINVPLYKLASAQIGTFPQIVRKVARTKKPVILSSGLATLNDLDEVVNIFQQEENSNYIILHCNSIYPTPFDKVHLNVMDLIKEKFDCPVGFSDHTDGIAIPIAAVARGAKVIEKHFAIDRNLPVPDAPFSLEPKEFKQMVEGIRAVEKAIIPDNRKALQNEETNFKEAIRYRLVLSRDVTEGELVKESDFKFLRSGQGIDCTELPEILSKNLMYREGLKRGKPLEAKNIYQ